jgi:group I intron endonuclease
VIYPTNVLLLGCKMSNYIIYMHRNIVNKKVYIGITNNPKRRWRLNGIEYRPPKSENQNGRRFWNAIEKYGWDSFEQTILEKDLSFDEAIEKEKQYIEKYDATNKSKGYNVSKGGNGGLVYSEHPKGMKGKQQTEFQKLSHKEWASVKENNCMTNGKVVWGVTHEHPKGMSGKTHTEEHKKKISEIFKRGKHPNARKIITTLNECEKEFDCIGDCIEYHGISTVLFYKLVKSGEAFVMTPSNRWKNKHKHIIGLKINYK